MGSEIYVYIDYQGNKITGKFTPDINIAMGDSINISFNSDKIHLFDKETELSLLERNAEPVKVNNH